MKAQIYRFTRALAVCVTAAALAAPAAGAVPAPADRDVTTTPPVVETIDEGIDPASVALGAAGTCAIALLATVGATKYRRREGASTHEQVDVTR